MVDVLSIGQAAREPFPLFTRNLEVFQICVSSSFAVRKTKYKHL